MLRILTLILFLMSCSSHERTKYGAFKKKNGGGHQDITLQDYKVVSFKGNSSTKKKSAIVFAKFRAIEICGEEKFHLTQHMSVVDKSFSRTVTRTSSGVYPSYYYGMSPFYGRYSGFGYGFAFSSVNYDSWEETLDYPDIEVFFKCANEVFTPMIEFREVPGEEMRHLIKDLRGGLQIEKLMPDSSNNNKFIVGDIIIRANGERVEHIFQLLVLFHKNKNHKVTVDFLRNGLIIRGVTMIGKNVSDKIFEEQKQIIKSACVYKELKENALCK